MPDAKQTVTELAEHFEVSRQTIYNWRDAGCPIDQGEAAITAWLSANRPDESPTSERFLAAKIRKTEAEATRTELENAITRAHLVDRDAVERWLLQFVNSCRQHIECWPEQIIVSIPGEHRIVVHEILREKVRLLLLQLSQMPTDLWADAAVSGGADPAVADSATQE